MSKTKAILLSYKHTVEEDDGNKENIPSPQVDDDIEFEWGKHRQSSDEENDDSVTQRHRKLLTRNHLVHNKLLENI